MLHVKIPKRAACAFTHVIKAVADNLIPQGGRCVFLICEGLVVIAKRFGQWRIFLLLVVVLERHLVFHFKI